MTTPTTMPPADRASHAAHLRSMAWWKAVDIETADPIHRPVLHAEHLALLAGATLLESEI